MRIVIFEEDHFEVLDVYYNIFIKVFGYKNVFVITNEKVFNILKTKPTFNQILLTNNINRSNDLLEAIYNFVKPIKPDFFLYNTVILGEYAFAGKLTSKLQKNKLCTTVLTLHNINTFLKPAIFNCRNPYYIFKNILKFFYKKQLIKNVDALNVLCENQVFFLKKEFNNRKIITHIPPCIFSSKNLVELQNNLENKKLNIAILGAIDKNRKDYNTVLQAFNLLESRLQNIQLFLIGATNNEFAKEVIWDFEALAKKYALSLWYNKTDNSQISNSQLESLLLQCNLFICPTLPTTTFEANLEFYGITKSTGNFYDIVRHKIPALFPSPIPIPPSLKECVISYSNSESLADTINSFLINSENLKRLEIGVNNLKGYYSEDFIVASVKQQFENLISTNA